MERVVVILMPRKVIDCRGSENPSSLDVLNSTPSSCARSSITRFRCMRTEKDGAPRSISST